MPIPDGYPNLNLSLSLCLTPTSSSFLGLTLDTPEPGFCVIFMKLFLQPLDSLVCFWICRATVHKVSLMRSPSQPTLPPSFLLSSLMVHAGKWEVGWGLTCGGQRHASVSLPQTMLSLVSIGRDSEYFTTPTNPE